MENQHPTPEFRVPAWLTSYENICHLLAYVMSGVLITLSFLGSFPQTNDFFGWLGTFLPIFSSFPAYQTNIAFVVVIFVPNLFLSFVLIEFTYKRVMREQMTGIQIQLRRGFPLWTVVGRFFLKYGSVAVLGSFLGVLLAGTLLKAREGYSSGLYPNDALITQHYSFPFTRFDLAYISIVVVVMGLFFILSTRHLRGKLTIDGEIPTELPRLTNSARLILQLFLTLVSIFFLLELVALNRQVEHPIMVGLLVGSFVLVIVGTTRSIFDILGLVFRFDAQPKTEVPENNWDVIRRLFLPLVRLSVRFGVPTVLIVLGLALATWFRFHQLQDLTLLLLVVTTIALAILYFSPHRLLISTFQKTNWLDRKVLARSFYLITFLTLVVSVAIIQNTAYATIAQTAVDDSYYQNYGAKIAVAPNPTTMHDPQGGLTGEEEAQLLAIDEDITASLRLYINTKHSVAPMTGTNLDLLMFDPAQYLSGGFLLRDEWFVGGTSAELFQQLEQNNSTKHTENGTAPIILDVDLAARFLKNIGDTIVLKPHYDHLTPQGSSGIEYRFTIVGLVKHFPGGVEREYSTDNPDHRPFGLLNINLASPQFQNPPLFSSPKPDKHLTSYWLLETRSGTDLEALKEKIFELDTHYVFDRRDTATIATILADSPYLTQTYEFYQVAGVFQYIYLFVGISGGALLLTTMFKEEEGEEPNLVNTQLGGGFSLKLTGYLNKTVLVSIGVVLGTVVGSLTAEVFSQVLLPSSSLPTVVITLDHYGLLLTAVCLFILLTILFLTSSRRRDTNLSWLTTASAISGLVVIIISVILPKQIEELVVDLTIHPSLDLVLLTSVTLVFALAVLLSANSYLIVKNWFGRANGSQTIRMVNKDSWYGSWFAFGMVGFMTTFADMLFDIIPLIQGIDVLLLTYVVGGLFFVSFEIAVMRAGRIVGGALVVTHSILLTLVVIAGEEWLVLAFILPPCTALLLHAHSHGFELKMPKLNLNWLAFYGIVVKKLFQNKQRLVVLTSGLILATALIAGVSTHVDTVSQGVIDNYFGSSDRVNDLLIDFGEHNGSTAEAFLTQSQEQYPWINDTLITYRWHVHYMDTRKPAVWDRPTFDGRTPPPNINPAYYTPEYITYSETFSVLSVRPEDKDLFLSLLEVENGNLTLEEGQALVTGRWGFNFLNTNDYLGMSFRIFDWMQSSVYRDMDTRWESPALEIVGTVSETSPLLDYYFNLGPTYPGFQVFKGVGGIILLGSEDQMPSFWDQLKYQPGKLECPECPSFETLASILVDHTQIDQFNPTRFNEELEDFQESLIKYYTPATSLIRVESPLSSTLAEYIQWTTQARAGLILLSIPIIYLGWFVADFTFAQIYRERRKEVSSLKSRGVGNDQIIGMLGVEALFLVVVSSSIGLVLGMGSNYVLEWFNVQSEETSVFAQILETFELVLTGGPLKESAINLFISPATILIVYLAGVLLVVLGSFRPMREVINWPIEEILQTEHEEGRTHETEREVTLRNLRNYLGLGLLGMAILFGINTLEPALQQTNLVIVLAFLSLGAMFVGLVRGMADIARLLPSLVETLSNLEHRARTVYFFVYWGLVGIFLLLFIVSQDKLGLDTLMGAGLLVLITGVVFVGIRTLTQNAQWYVTSREMRRHSKTTVAAFIVISLTIGFGIISSTVVVSSSDYYQRDAVLEVGVDGLQLKTLNGRENSFPEQFTKIEDQLRKITGVTGVSRYYITHGFGMAEQNPNKVDWPAISLFNLYINLGVVEQTEVVFVDKHYFSTAFLPDHMFVNDSLTAINERFNETLSKYEEDRLTNNYLPIIIDEETANEKDLQVGDSYLFVSGRVTVFKGYGKVVGIAKYLPPGLNNPFVLLPYVPTIWKQFSISNPTTGYLVRTENQTISDDVRTIIKGNLDYYGIQDSFMPNDILKDRNIALEMNTLIQVMNLDFLYSLVLAGVGVFLVLEFRTAQRSREIGSLKSVGLSKRGTISLVMLEAGIIIIVAVITGLLVGWVGGYSLTNLLPPLRVERHVILPLDLIIPEILIGIVFSFTGAIVSSTRTNRYQISLLIK